ncbi:MAG: YbaB/EbfC family nucleoid-associated protein [Pseudomonadales bacterium]
MKGLNDLMQQAQKLQEQMQEAQAEKSRREVEGEAGAGMVAVRMNGQHDVKAVRIDPSLLREDVEMLEDLIAAAVNDAVRKVEESNRDSMAELTAGLNLPDGFKMPF